MRHVPQGSSHTLQIHAFPDALQAYHEVVSVYDKDKWLYVPPMNLEYRYILGTKGKNPLICIGINPSTARPDALDRTLQSVERVSLVNGYDSFIMFNVYAQRATNPDDMDQLCNLDLHAQNMEAFRYCLQMSKNPSPGIWAAWGTIIEKRPWLPQVLKDMIRISGEFDAQWLSAGKRSKAGHPHHPLYLSKNSPLDAFDIQEYLQSLR